jgi:hypothetical protein
MLQLHAGNIQDCTQFVTPESLFNSAHAHSVCVGDANIVRPQMIFLEE